MNRQHWSPQRAAHICSPERQPDRPYPAIGAPCRVDDRLPPSEETTHNDADAASSTHFAASGNRHYRVLGSAIRVGTGKARQLLDRSVLSASASTIFVVVTFRRAE